MSITENRLKEITQEAQKKQLDVKKSKTNAVEQFLRHEIEWRKARYLDQMWKKLDDSSYIKSISTKIEKAATEGYNYVEIPAITIYYNNISFAKVGLFSFNMYKSSICEKVLVNYFPQHTSFHPDVKLRRQGYFTQEMGKYLYSSRGKYLLVTSGAVLVNDYDRVKQINKHLAFHGINVKVELYTTENWLGIGMVGLRFEW